MQGKSNKAKKMKVLLAFLLCLLLFLSTFFYFVTEHKEKEHANAPLTVLSTQTILPILVKN